MANCITRSIPNTLTCLNLFSGCIACIMAFEANYNLALLFIIFSAVFDFFDGMMAVVFSLFKEMHYPASMEFMAAYMPYASFLISVFSALRLAKFNNDTRQTSSFIGVPVPANALFWASLAAGMHPMLISDSFNPLYLLMLVCLFSWLLVSEIPMFSLKFKNLSWKDNKISFIFLIVCIPLLVFLKVSGFAAVIVWYIVLSLLTGKSK